MIMTKRRSALSPLIFECIMYLKYNHDMWDLADVVEANKRRKNETSEARRALREKVAARAREVAAWDAVFGEEEEEEE